MKCENCGREEVNFHFTSNINGSITEKHLCAECAAKLGFTDKAVFKPEMSFEDAFMDLFGGMPNRRMFTGYGLMLPTFVIPTVGMIIPGAAYDGGSAQPVQTAEIKPELDAEMQKRREINILREQMRQAADAEEYEKAAVLRDSIRKLENVENS
jgi:protein arginine kinase activator